MRAPLVLVMMASLSGAIAVAVGANGANRERRAAGLTAEDTAKLAVAEFVYGINQRSASVVGSHWWVDLTADGQTCPVDIRSTMEVLRRDPLSPRLSVGDMAVKSTNGQVVCVAEIHWLFVTSDGDEVRCYTEALAISTDAEGRCGISSAPLTAELLCLLGNSASTADWFTQNAEWRRVVKR